MVNSQRIADTLKALPSNKGNIAASMRQAGYALSTTRSGQQYARIRKRLDKYYSDDQIKADILSAEQDFKKSGDNAARCRMIELRTKVKGLTKDVAIAGVSVSIGDTIAQLKGQHSVEVSPKEVKGSEQVVI